MMLVECYKIQIAVKKFIRRGRGQLPFQLTPILPQLRVLYHVRLIAY